MIFVSFFHFNIYYFKTKIISPDVISKIAISFWKIIFLEISSFKILGNLRERKTIKINKKTY